MANLSISPASAMADISLDDVMEVAGLRDVLLEALDEAAAVARASGIHLENEQAGAILDQLTGGRGTGTTVETGSQLISRPSEIMRRALGPGPRRNNDKRERVVDFSLFPPTVCSP